MGFVTFFFLAVLIKKCFKGIANHKNCHLLTLILFHTCMSFFMLNIKEGILKNAGNQTVDRPCWLP